MNTETRGPWLETFSGVHFHPLDPHPEDVRIEDIAHALSNVCRYAGHSRFFYSVAEHSVYVAGLVRPELRLAALVHDGGEAYTGDWPRPLKHPGGGEGLEATRAARWYRWIENKNRAAIHQALGLDWPLEKNDGLEIDRADFRVLSTEARDVMSGGADWGMELAPVPSLRIAGWSPKHAEGRFLAAFKAMRGTR